ncbi:hypothetical protein [Clostridium sp. YIM B02555]|uniref:hypothetical protein n=1 Tax=Clostridium sp. YIM B02555 TaxID=2911968 RepID=UPI001EED02D8|nr:hypothetical protein [Clostridium sp. YIM B02555]
MYTPLISLILKLDIYKSFKKYKIDKIIKPLARNLLSHGLIEITADIYTHVIDSEKISAVKKLTNLFK